MDTNEKEDEFLEKINSPSYKYEKKQGTVVNNFFTIITIAIVCLTILWYVNYILPNQNAIKKAEILKQEKIQNKINKYNKRQKQIELSKRLNAKS